MALNPTDKLLAGYVGLVTIVLLTRGNFADLVTWQLLGMHALVVVLLVLCTRLDTEMRVGGVLHDLYPLLLLPALYAEIGVLSAQLGLEVVFQNDAIVQQWEAALFGMQVSYEWIRRAPSAFWSAVLHLGYLSYYPIILAGPILLVARGERAKGRLVLFATAFAFVVCYIVFVMFPVAGPNYAFPHPTGPVRDVWSARLVYALLDGGSSFGAAFPSSHVAATVAAVITLWNAWRALAGIFLIPAILLIVGTVYCQMHYGIDTVAGLVVGTLIGVQVSVGAREKPRREETY